ncbi:MAG: 30S ribosomal protein S20 [Patescibacteria group bacterium]
MPNTKSAEKALRQSKTRRARNVTRAKAYKDVVKQFRKLVEAGNVKEAQKLLPAVFQKIDKAAKTGVIKPNKASNLKSGVSKRLAKK